MPKKSSSKDSVWGWFKEKAAPKTRPEPNAAEIGHDKAQDPWGPIKAMAKDLEAKGKKEKKVAKLVTKDPVAEAVSGSAQPAIMRDGPKESETIQVQAFSVGENASGPVATDGRKFRVILIQEGLGNFKDAFYYTKEALITAAPLFEGKKFFVDHPDAAEEINRPERSVKDVAGYFENCQVEDMDGRAVLTGDLIVFESAKMGWVRDLLKKCVSYRERHPGELVGLSINAGGEAEDWELEEFMRKQRIPASSLGKLHEAREKGITVIKVVKQFQSAVSCDLVTEAGAGGRVIKMLEQEKHMGKKIEAKGKEAEEKKKMESEESEEKHHQAEESEEKKHESEESEESEEAAPAPAPKADAEPAHDDEQQDIELIKKMMKKHLGDQAGEEESEVEMCKQAHQAAMEAGMEGEEAEKAACYGMKMAAIMAKKKEGEEKKEAAQPSLGSPGKPGAVGKESAKEIALVAEVTKLRESLKKYETEKHLDKVLRESGYPRSVTDAFRKLVENARSAKEIDEKFKVFKEAYGFGSESARPSFMLTVEKTEADSAQGSGSGLSFADCVNE